MLCMGVSHAAEMGAGRRQGEGILSNADMSRWQERLPSVLLAEEQHAQISLPPYRQVECCRVCRCAGEQPPSVLLNGETSR